MASESPARPDSPGTSSVYASRVPMLVFGAIFAFIGGVDIGRGDVLGGIAQAALGLAFIVWIEATHRGASTLARIAAVIAVAFSALWIFTVFA